MGWWRRSGGIRFFFLEGGEGVLRGGGYETGGFEVGVDVVVDDVLGTSFVEGHLVLSDYNLVLVTSTLSPHLEPKVYRQGSICSPLLSSRLPPTLGLDFTLYLPVSPSLHPLPKILGQGVKEVEGSRGLRVWGVVGGGG